MLREHEETVSDDAGVPPSTTTETPDVDQIKKALYKYDRAESANRDGSKLIHASALNHSPDCSRLHALMYSMKQEGMKFMEPVFGSMRLTWAYGRAAEAHARTALLADPAIKKAAYGQWACKCGKSKYTGHHDPTATTCGSCGRKPFEYREVALLNHRLGISGNPDMILKQGSRYTVIEIKSIKGESSAQYAGFKGLDTPDIKHVQQGTGYVYLARDKGLRMHDKPVVLYVNKSHDMREWYKPFLATDEVQARVNAAVEETREIAQVYTHHRERGTIPPKCAACQSNPQVYEKRCPVYIECIHTK